MARRAGNDAVAMAREYYCAIDDGDYEALAALLATDFVHERPDRTFEGRAAFVDFMRSGRPSTDTTHPIDAIFVDTGGVAVQGRLLDTDGAELAAFVDVFTVADGRFRHLRTYTH